MLKVVIDTNIFISSLNKHLKDIKKYIDIEIMSPPEFLFFYK